MRDSEEVAVCKPSREPAVDTRPTDIKPADTLTLDVQPAETEQRNVCGSSLWTPKYSGIFCYGRWSRLTQSRVCQDVEPWEVRETVYYETFSLRVGQRGWDGRRSRKQDRNKDCPMLSGPPVPPSYGLHPASFL